MTDWQPYARRETALKAIETRLAAGEASVELRLAHADLLAQLDRADAAKDAYLAVLQAHPGHLAALNNFGALVHRLGYRAAAKTLYEQAVLLHPDDPMANVNLANSLVEAGDVAAAEAGYHAALRAVPDYAPAHRGLAHLASMRGDAAGAARHLRAGFGRQPVIEQPYSGAGAPIEVLLLISGLDADIPLDHVLDPAIFRVTALAPAFFDRRRRLPAHHLVFNAIGDADLCAGALKAAAALVQRTDRPVINPPDRVAATGRVANAKRLGAIPGVASAASARLSHSQAARLTGAADLAALGLRPPIAARAPGFHTGQHFERLDDLGRLEAVLSRLPGDELILMNFINTRGGDGRFRKYRAMVVDGRLFPLHLAVSDDWKVHYFTADMAHDPARRAEDAAFLGDMAGVIGATALGALERVREALGLDYGGIDFALSPTGEVVVFEANAAMVVYPPGPEPMWDYRRAPVQTVLDAVRAMIVDRVGRIEPRSR